MKAETSLMHLGKKSLYISATQLGQVQEGGAMDKEGASKQRLCRVLQEVALNSAFTPGTKKGFKQKSNIILLCFEKTTVSTIQRKKLQEIKDQSFFNCDITELHIPFSQACACDAEDKEDLTHPKQAPNC